MNKKIEIFTDGACIKNPGPGGYSAILRYKKEEKELSAGYKLTTNNRMELMAAIVALETLKSPCDIILHTDSQYILKGITEWIFFWKKNHWKTSKKTLVKNVDLWRRLDIATHKHKLYWNWIKGHSGHKENIRCDSLAKAATEYPIFDDIGFILKISD